ncbi:hypothetical protein PanNE5_02970 [Pandoraea sp. NE5]|uniref:hypothetical protein n=1 Tax=Pandoraea sp. NE5 TaxID=2904129 RepID=UPI0021C29BBA|nr:hypothetical protein [Pandoraea sp. NE5]BDD90857.1 hypothetical protein PanNE5_02970 [Pandoraea sp. NE5]
MFRIDDATAATALPAPEAAGTEGYFTEGNPTAGTPATNVRGSWLNMIQEELRAIVVAGGLTPSKTTYNQVLSAIKRIGQNTIVLADTGAANAYTAVNATPLVAGTWIDGVVQAVKIAHANTGASTYAPDGLTPIPIYGLGLQALQGGELAVGGTAVLMHATIPGVNSGNPICVLMECAGGAQQIAPATQSQHAVQLAQVQSVAGISGSPSNRNKLVNGWAYIAQDTARSLSTSPQYGLVDMVAAWASGGSVSAGTITQDTASPVGRTGYAVKLAGVTLTGSGQVSWRYRMDAAEALKLKNQTSQFQIAVQHDVGSAINYTVVVRKPTVADNYTGTTVISTSSAVSVPSGTPTKLVPFASGVALGDVSNGIEIEVQAACGAVTTKNFWFTEWQIEEGMVAGPFEYRPISIDMPACERVFQKIGFSANTYTLGQRGNAAAANTQYMNAFYRVRMRAAPAGSVVGTWVVSNCSQPGISACSDNSTLILTTATAAGDFYFLLNSASTGIVLDSRL